MAGHTHGPKKALPHPDSPAGRNFDWSGVGLPHPHSPVGRNFDWSGVGLPHPHSPAGQNFDLSRGWLSSAGGYAKSTLLWIVDLLPFKPDSPVSTALLRHYVEASGEPYEINPVPSAWQEWIIKVTKGKLGKHRELNPYNEGLYDLQNSLGHFDVLIKVHSNSNLRIYELEDTYEFGFVKNDKHPQRHRHGFPLGKLGTRELWLISELLPSGTHHNPGGFDECWELKHIGKETILFIPQDVLASQGKSFRVHGKFER